MSSELLRQRRFLPYFLTQALGAFNDNVFKNALVILISYSGLRMLGMESKELVPFAFGVFILPFFLFSALAGQLAEKYTKALLIRRIKLLEIGIMSTACLGFWMDSVPMLIGVLFLMGTQSALFGPLKLSYLPEYLDRSELVDGNGLVSMATFLAILLGTILGGELIKIRELDLLNLERAGPVLISLTVMILAVAGWLVSRKIPEKPAAMPDLAIRMNLFTETIRTVGYTRENLVVFRSILGVSWFWFFGSVILAQIITLNSDVLLGNERVTTWMLACFSVGIGIGSMLCAKLSFRQVEIGLVPLGAIGMSVFGVDLYFACVGLEPVAELVGISEFIAREGAWRVFIDIVLIGLFGGLYIVPLNALIQHRSSVEKRSRILAGGNVLNALFMVISAVYCIVLLKFMTIPELLLTTAILNAVVALYIFLLVPEFLLRFFAWILINTVYRVKVRDLERLPDEGPVLLVCNHVSFIDALVVGGSIRRPVRFVMYHKLFNLPLMRKLYQTARAIPIASARENPELLEAAYDRIAEELEDGQVVCLFPEGRISEDGVMNEFRGGVEHILKRTPVTVVPMALRGLWGSFFSKSDGGAFRGPLRKLSKRIDLIIGQPVQADQANAAVLRERVHELMGEEQHQSMPPGQ